MARPRVNRLTRRRLRLRNTTRSGTSTRTRAQSRTIGRRCSSMMRREMHFATRDKLIVVLARITGPRRSITAPLILDIGTVYTTITPKVAEAVGYSERDGDP